MVKFNFKYEREFGYLQIISPKDKNSYPMKINISNDFAYFFLPIISNIYVYNSFTYMKIVLLKILMNEFDGKLKIFKTFQNGYVCLFIFDQSKIKDLIKFINTYQFTCKTLDCIHDEIIEFVSKDYECELLKQVEFESCQISPNSILIFNKSYPSISVKIVITNKLEIIHPYKNCDLDFSLIFYDEIVNRIVELILTGNNEVRKTEWVISNEMRTKHVNVNLAKNINSLRVRLIKEILKMKFNLSYI